MNSKHIKNANEHYAAGLISLWQFLSKCSYACSSYEQRQRQWALGLDDLNDIDNYDYIDDTPEVLPLQAIDNPQVDNDNVSTCMTCLSPVLQEHPVQFIVLPCGHAWVCGVCVAVLNDQYPRRCPMCRAEVDTFQQIFYG